MAIVILIVRVLLAAVFAVAGAAKLADREGSRKSMVDFGVPAFLGRPLTWLVPVAELACAAALLWTPVAQWGAGGLLGMLIVFSAAMAIALARGRRPDCRCFGQLHASPIGAKTLARNAVLAAMAALVVWQGPQPVNTAALWSTLSGSQSALSAIVVLLAVLQVSQIWIVIQVLRQNGRLMVRIETLEGKGTEPSPEPEPREPQGLKVNTPAPPFSLQAVDGRTVTLDSLREAGKPILLFFNEPTCGPCNAMLPEVARWQTKHAERLLIVPISRGDLEANRARNAEHHLRLGLLQTGETGDAYKVVGTPTAVLVNDGKIASPLAEGRKEITALVARSVVPPPLKKGDPAPSLSLTDLDGRIVDLATLRGRRRLLLFWNPSCGFCQQMLPDLKAWERNFSRNAVELLVISKGTPEAIRAQGFLSTVLVDQSFAAGETFGAGGTPAAVILDEDGRVASEVGVGAPGVLALAGAVPVTNDQPA